MPVPTRYEISLNGRAWALSQDGRHLHDYSHADRAVQEAMSLARELERTGQPATVWVKAKEGRLIEVRPDPERAHRALVQRSAIVPSRSPSG